MFVIRIVTAHTFLLLTIWFWSCSSSGPTGCGWQVLGYFCCRKCSFFRIMSPRWVLMRCTCRAAFTSTISSGRLTPCVWLQGSMRWCSPVTTLCHSVGWSITVYFCFRGTFGWTSSLHNWLGRRLVINFSWNGDRIKRCIELRVTINNRITINRMLQWHMSNSACS